MRYLLGAGFGIDTNHRLVCPQVAFQTRHGRTSWREHYPNMRHCLHVLHQVSPSSTGNASSRRSSHVTFDRLLAKKRQSKHGTIPTSIQFCCNYSLNFRCSHPPGHLVTHQPLAALNCNVSVSMLYRKQTSAQQPAALSSMSSQRCSPMRICMHGDTAKA